MLGVNLDFGQYSDRLKSEISRLPGDQVARFVDKLEQAYKDDRQVFIIGNGGSATSASHFAEDLGKGLLSEDELKRFSRRRLRVQSLTDNNGWLLAIGNDLGYEHVFTQQLANFARTGDLLIAISGSGNSPNILNAVRWARDNSLFSFGLTGFNGGQLKQIQDDGIHVELNDMGMVESLLLCIFHWVLNDLYARIHQEGRHRIG
jgi:D-sedoheptulose 7-phosphate isomerase